MKTVVIVNRNRLSAKQSAIAVVNGDTVGYVDEVVIHDKDGNKVAILTGVAMGHDKINGARIWLETDCRVTTSRSKHD